MEVLQRDTPSESLQALTAPEQGERAARRSLRMQIAKLERELAEAFVTAYPLGGLDAEPASGGA
ncbi:MAG: hypothetical protein WCD11_24010, partial [Solirubrobacteraceae bacterium]